MWNLSISSMEMKKKMLEGNGYLDSPEVQSL